MSRLTERIIGPVFAREMLEASRRRRTYFLRTAYGLGLLYVLYVNWESSLGFTPNLALMSALSSRVAGALMLFQWIAVFFCAPILICNVVVGERNAGTLDLLFCSQLTNREIILGKLASRLMILISLVLSSTPVLALMSLFGGVDLEQVVVGQWMTFVSMLLVGTIAMHATTRRRSAVTALIQTYVVTALAIAVIWFASFLLLELVGLAFPPGGDWVLLIIVSLLCLIPSGWFLKRSFEQLRIAPAPRRRRLSLLRRVSVFAQAARRTREGLWGPLQIHIVDEEPSLLRHWWVFIVMFAAWVFNLLMIQRYQSSTLTWLLVGIWNVTFILTAIVAVNNPLFARRPGFFDLLLTTLLEPSEMLLGSVMVAWPMLLRIYLVPLMFSVFWGYDNPAAILSLAMIGVLFGTWMLTLGNLCSLADPRATHRSWPIALAPLLLVIGPYFLPNVLRLSPGIALMSLALTWAISFLLVSLSMSAGAVGFFCAATYLACAAGAPSAIALIKGVEIDPALFASPYYWMRKSIPSNLDELPLDRGLLSAYVVGLILTMIICWRFAASRLDDLVGRTSPQRA